MKFHHSDNYRNYYTFFWEVIFQGFIFGTINLFKRELNIHLNL